MRTISSENASLRDNVQALTDQSETTTMAKLVETKQRLSDERLLKKALAERVARRREGVRADVLQKRCRYLDAFLPEAFRRSKEEHYVEALCLIDQLRSTCPLIQEELKTAFSASMAGAGASDADYHTRSRVCFAAYLNYVIETASFVSGKLERRIALAGRLANAGGGEAAEQLEAGIGEIVPQLRKGVDVLEHYVGLLEQARLDETIGVEPLEQLCFSLMTLQRSLPSGDNISSTADEEEDESDSDAALVGELCRLTNASAKAIGVASDWLRDGTLWPDSGTEGGSQHAMKSCLFKLSQG